MTTTKTMNHEQAKTAIDHATQNGWISNSDGSWFRDSKRPVLAPIKGDGFMFTHRREEVALLFAQPVIGLPCTIVVGSDKYPAEIVDVTKATVRVMDRHGEITRYYRVKRWGRELFASKTKTLTLGVAVYYLDPSF